MAKIVEPVLHRDIYHTENHTTISFEYQDEQERLDARLGPFDIGKVARQLSDNTIWILGNYDPMTWIELRMDVNTIEFEGFAGVNITIDPESSLADTLSRFCDFIDRQREETDEAWEDVFAPDEYSGYEDIIIITKGIKQHIFDQIYSILDQQIPKIAELDAKTQPCIITTIQPDHGQITPMNPEVMFGANITLTFIPDHEYELDYIEIDGVQENITSNTYTFTHVLEDITVSVTYKQVSLTQIQTTIPSTIDENTSASIKCTATFSDGSTRDITSQATWTSSNVDHLSIDGNNKQIHAGEVPSDSSINIGASYTVRGVTKTDSNSITVVDLGRTLDYIETDFPLSVEENTTSSVSCIAYFTDGTSEGVGSLSTWTSTHPDVLSYSGGNLIANEVPHDIVVTIGVTYEENGKSDGGNVHITVIDMGRTLDYIDIVYPDTIEENNTYPISAVAYFTDGTSEDITTQCTWAVSQPSIITINTSSKIMTVGEVPSDTNITLTVEYTLDGTTHTKQSTYNVVDTGRTLDYISVSTDDFIAEDMTVAVSCTAYFTDQTSQDITSIVNWSSSLGSISPSGVFSPPDVTENTNVTITGSYSEGGLTKEDNTTIMVLLVRNLTSITITGPNTVPEDSTASYTATANYDDGYTKDITTLVAANWSCSEGSISNGTYYPPDVSSNISVDINVSYSDGGINKTKTKAITVGQVLVLTSLNISGPTSVAEDNTATFAAEAVYDDSSTNNVTTSVTWSASSGSISSSGVLTPPDVSSDTDITVSASYTEEGVTKTNSHTITVTQVQILTSIQITGPSSVDEDSTASLICTATYNDGVTKTVTNSTSWSSGSGSVNSLGVFTPPTVTTNTNVTISASYSEAGVTKTDTHNITVNNTTSELQSIAITGGTSVNEDSTLSLTCTATYDDGSQDVTSSANWSATQGSISSSGIYTPPTVTSDTSVTITATFGGETDTHSVTVNNTASELQSIAISGSTSVNEDSTLSLTCTATYDDGSQDVTSSANWSDGGAGGSFTGGVYTPPTVTSHTSVTITATFNGQTDNHSITVYNTVSELQSIIISGGSSVNEGSTLSLVCTATYDDGMHTVTSSASWSVISGGGSISTSGTYTAPSVTSNTNVTVRASFNGETDDYTFTVVNTSNELESITISGPTTVYTDDPQAFTCTATYDNSTTSNVSSFVTWSDGGAGGSFSGNVYTPPGGMNTETVTLSTSYTYQGVTKTDTFDISAVKLYMHQNPSTDPMDERSQRTMTFVVHYSDGSTQTIGSEATWSATLGSFSNNVYTAPSIDGETTDTISYSYANISNTIDITINEIDAATLDQIIISPVTSIPENSTYQLTCTAHYSDGSTNDITSSVFWTTNFGSVSSSGLYTVSSVSDDQVVSVTATYNGETHSISITVTNVSVTDTSNYGMVWEYQSTVAPHTSPFYGYVSDFSRITTTDFVASLKHDTGGVIVKSTNSGSTWSVVDTNTDSSACECLVNMGSGIIVASYHARAYIKRSIDSGNTWTTVKSFSAYGTSSVIHTLCRGNLSKVMAFLRDGSNYELWYSTNNGATWSLSSYVPSVHIVAAIHLGSGLILGGATDGSIIRSTDNGLNWTTISTGATSPIQGICYTDNNVVLFCTFDGDIYKSEDDGLIWSNIYTYVDGFDSLTSNGPVVIAGKLDEVGFLRSDDDGSTWTSVVYTSTESSVTAVEYFNDGIYLAGTMPNGIILKSTSDMTPPAATLDYITVSSNPAYIYSGTSSNYFTATAYYSDASNEDISSLASWSADVGSFSGNSLSMISYADMQIVNITASYTDGGITKQSTRIVRALPMHDVISVGSSQYVYTLGGTPQNDTTVNDRNIILERDGVNSCSTSVDAIGIGFSAIHAESTSEIYAAGLDGIFKYNGSSWSRLSPDHQGYYINDVYKTSNALFCAIDGGIHYLPDGESSWLVYSECGTYQFRRLVHSPNGGLVGITYDSTLFKNVGALNPSLLTQITNINLHGFIYGQVSTPTTTEIKWPYNRIINTLDLSTEVYSSVNLETQGLVSSSDSIYGITHDPYSSDEYAVTREGKILKYNGTSWSLLDTLAIQNLYRAQYMNHNILYILRYYGGVYMYDITTGHLVDLNSPIEDSGYKTNDFSVL